MSLPPYQAVEQGIKPGQEAVKDALSQARQQIPEPQEAKRSAHSVAGQVALIVLLSSPCDFAS